MVERMRESSMNFGQLAAHVGVSRAHVGNIASGIRTPSVPLAMRLASALNVPWEAFFDPSRTNTQHDAP